VRRSILSFVAVLTACTAPALVAPLAAGAATSASSLTAVTISDDASKPTLHFSTPFAVKKTANRVVSAGGGADVGKDDRVTVDYVIVDGRDGQIVESSYGTKSASLFLDKKQTLAALVNAVSGQKVGSRLLVAVAPKDGVAGNLAKVKGSTVKKGDTMLVLVDVRYLHPQLSRATGTPVTPVPGLPTVTLASDGKPTITVTGATPPSTLVVQPLIQGGGPVVAAGETIHVHYSGVIWASGKQFDSSWDRGTPTDFTIGAGQVIKGWDTGLVGQKVGSQVLLVVPPDQGYGAQGQASAGITGTDTLVFVVDILDAY
jgi:peptidylprolyl isomerase